MISYSMMALNSVLDQLSKIGIVSPIHVKVSFNFQCDFYNHHVKVTLADQSNA